jgi:4-amino-4-deoxy-L-arabinose transferase-like glycosyltransferase
MEKTSRTACLKIGLMLLAILIELPFLNQPFHMDDTMYLYVADNIRIRPLFPQDAPYTFEGISASDMAWMEHSPLTAYLLAFARRVQDSEAACHAAFLIFPIILILAMQGLAARFVRNAAIAAVLVTTLPVVYVLSHTLMCDVPLLALWTAATAVFISGVDRSSAWRIRLGASLALVAVLISYAGIWLAPLLALYGCLNRNRRAACTVVLVPVTGITAWLAVNSFHYGRLVPVDLLSYYFGTFHVLSGSALWLKVLYFVDCIGATFILPVLALESFSTRRLRIWIAAGIQSLIAIATCQVRQYPWSEQLLFFVCFTAGVIVLAQPLRAAFGYWIGRLSPDDLFLALWVIWFLSLSIIVFMTGSARYLVPLTPAVVLLLLRNVERSSPTMVAGRVVLVVLPNALLALLLAVADYKFASIYREFAGRVPRNSGQIYLTGEWGFRAYLERRGGRELERGDRKPDPGDLIVTPSLAVPYETRYSEWKTLRSLVLLAPSEVRFRLPRMSENADFSAELGLPHWQQNNGMDISVSIVSQEKTSTPYSELVSPASGRRWTHMSFRLPALSDGGLLVLRTGTGPHGNVDGDWIAFGDARICAGNGNSVPVYDLVSALESAQIVKSPDIDYHTPGNQPAFALNVALEQIPAIRLRSSHSYGRDLRIRLLDEKVHAGFWSMGWGMLPFGIDSSGSPLEQFSIYEVIRKPEFRCDIGEPWYRQRF